MAETIDPGARRRAIDRLILGANVFQRYIVVRIQLECGAGEESCLFVFRDQIDHPDEVKAAERPENGWVRKRFGRPAGGERRISRDVG